MLGCCFVPGALAYGGYTPFKRVSIVVTGLVLLGAWAGCNSSEDIRRYQVAQESAPAVQRPETPGPKAHQPVAEDGDQRLLGAIVLRDEQAWFFKAVGPESHVAPQVEAFHALLRSVRFVDGKPEWNLPEDWQQKGESGMRFATLTFGPDEDPIELTVIPLGIPPGDRSAYVLSNVNRWRQQMHLEPMTAAEWSQQSEQIELEGTTAVVVDFAGGAKAPGP